MNDSGPARFSASPNAAHGQLMHICRGLNTSIY